MKFIDFGNTIINSSAISCITLNAPEEMKNEQKYKDNFCIFCLYGKGESTISIFSEEKDRDSIWNKLKKLLCEAEK